MEHEKREVDIMSKAVVTPVVGEFGWVVFEVQGKVRSFFNQTNCDEKIVICPKGLRFLFETATDFIDVPEELNTSMKPEGLGKQGRPYEYYEKLIEWTENNMEPNELLTIPYDLDVADRWKGDSSEYIKLESTTREWEPHIVVSARNVKGRGDVRNWSERKWDELCDRLMNEYSLPMYSIGKREDVYVPVGVEELDQGDDHLEIAVSCLNSAVFSISSNSGTTHLSTMSGCPTITWGQSGVPGSLAHRMTMDSNPLNTPIIFMDGTWDPSVEQVFETSKDWINKMNLLNKEELNVN